MIDMNDYVIKGKQTLVRKLWLVQLSDEKGAALWQITQAKGMPGQWHWYKWNPREGSTYGFRNTLPGEYFGFKHPPDKTTPYTHVEAVIKSHPHNVTLFKEFTKASKLRILERDYPQIIFGYLDADELPEDYEEPTAGWYWWAHYCDFMPTGPWSSEVELKLAFFDEEGDYWGDACTEYIKRGTFI